MSEEYPWDNGNKPTSETIECLASTAEILRPKKRTKVEELSTITLAYMKIKDLTKPTKNRNLELSASRTRNPRLRW
jgi:hypothetical protein